MTYNAFNYIQPSYYRNIKFLSGYSHIAFYQMDTGTEFIRQVTSEMRTELSFNGLISIPSTFNKSGAYIIGYGNNGAKDTKGFIYPMANVLKLIQTDERFIISE